MRQGSITASLEGMRVVVQEGICRLDEYDFVENRYFEKDSQPWCVFRAAPITIPGFADHRSGDRQGVHTLAATGPANNRKD